VQTVKAVGGAAAVDGAAVGGAEAGPPGEPVAGDEAGTDGGGVADDVLLRSSRAMTIAPTAMITAHTTAVIGHIYLFMSPPLDHF
jgi:hypothetical protein